MYQDQTQVATASSRLLAFPISLIPALVTIASGWPLLGLAAWPLAATVAVGCLGASLLAPRMGTVWVWFSAMGVGAVFKVRLSQLGAAQAGQADLSSTVMWLAIASATLVVAMVVMPRLQRGITAPIAVWWAFALAAVSFLVRGVAPWVLSRIATCINGQDARICGNTASGQIKVGVSVQAGSFALPLAVVSLALLVWWLRPEPGRTLLGTLKDRVSTEKLQALLAVVLLLAYVYSLRSDMGHLALFAIAALVVPFGVIGVKPLRLPWKIVLGLVAVAGLAYAISDFQQFATQPLTGEQAEAAAADPCAPDRVQGGRIEQWAYSGLISCQLHRGIQAASAAGLLGRGLGWNPLVQHVPVNSSDLIIDSILGDWGVLGTGILLVVLLVAFGRLLARIPTGNPIAAAAVGLNVMLAASLIWSALYATSIAPFSGISAAFIVLDGAAVTSSALIAGMGEGLGAGPRHPTYAAHLATAGAIIVAIGLVAWCGITPTTLIGQVEPRLAPKGKILARDGQVLAEGTGIGGTGFVREYPQGDAYASAVGRLLSDGSAYGLESTEGPLLACGGDPGWVASGLAKIRPPDCVPTDIISSLDPAWMTAVEKGLKGQRGGAYVIDAQTGEILVEYSTDMDGYYDAPTGQDVTAYESWADQKAAGPGSTMKMFTAAAALDFGVSFANRPLTKFTPGGELIQNAGEATGSASDLDTAMAESINTVFAAVAVDMMDGTPEANYLDYLKEHFGFDSAYGMTTGLRVDCGAGQCWPVYGDADGTQLATEAMIARTGIGLEGVRATPRGVANAVASLVQSAAGERLPLPHLDTGYCTNGAYMPLDQGYSSLKPVDAKTAKRVLKAMDAVVTRGTMESLKAEAKRLKLDVVGKSGTATGQPKSLSSTGNVRWATVVVDSRYVATVEVTDAPDRGANMAIAAFQKGLLKAMSQAPADPTGC